MKIKKFAGGGITYLPTTNRVAEETVKTTVSSEDSSKKNKVVDKLFDLIKEKGLDSDVAKFANAIEMKLQMGLDPNGENLTQRDLVQLAQMASSVTTNYERYNTAVKNLTEQNAEADAAIDDRGRIYCYNIETGKVDALTIDKIKEQHDSLQVLTNAELLNLRRSRSDLAYNTKIIDDINNAVGIDTITRYLQDTISKFKTSTVEGYSEKQQNAIASGLQALAGGNVDQKILAAVQAGPDGIYKIKNTDTIVDQDIKAALNYLQSTLPNKMKRKLETTAVIEGYDPNAFMITMLAANTERSFTTSWEGQIDKDDKLGKTTAGEKAGSEVQHTLMESYADGANLPPEERIPISPIDSNTSLLVSGQNAGPIRKANGQNPGGAMPIANVAQVLEDAYGIREITNGTVTFGDQLIAQKDLGGLVYDGSNMYRVVMPSKVINGRDIVPDYELQEKLDGIITAAEEQGMDDATIQRYVSQACPGAKYDSSRGIIILPKDRQHVFLTFGAVASPDYIDFKESNYLIRADENGYIDKDVYSEAAKYGYANPENGQKRKPRVAGTASQSGWFKFWTGTDLYRGNVFIPITSSISGSTMSNQGYIPKSAYRNITGQVVENNRQEQVRNEFASGQRETNW